MMDKDITDPSFRYAPSQNPIDPLNSSSATALPNTMAQQVDFVPSGDDFADTIAKATRQRIADQNNAMMLSMSKAAAGNAEEAAAAQRLGYETGVGSEIAARNKQLLEQRLATDRLAQLDLFRRDPVLARMLANKDFAAVAHDDLPNLMESGEQINPDLSWIDEFLIGRARGYKGTELGMTGMDMLAAKASGVPIPESLRAKAAQQKQELAELRASGGFLESFGALEGNIESTIPKQAEMALYGAVAGGLVLGAPTGGIGMVPGMVAGAGMGVMSAGVVQSFQIEGGNLFVDMLDDGIPEDTALVAAPIGGAIMAALEILPLKFVTGEAKKLIKREVAGPVIDTLKQTGMLDVTKRFLQSYGIGVTTEVGTELAQDAVSTYVQEMAMLATDPLYEEKWKSEKGRAELAKQFVDTFIEVGQGMAIMGAFLPGANFIGDARRASKAKATRQFFKDIDKNASESKLKGRNPRSYQEWFEEKARGTANHTLFIDIEKLREAMAKNNVSAEQLEIILPGVTKAIADAKGMNGIDFAFPTSVYAARLSDIAFGQALQEHMRFDPNDMSIAENNQYVKEREQIVEEMKQSAMELMKADAAIEQSAQAVTDSVTAQLVATGRYTESDARSMASVASASATVMSARFNMTPLDWHNKYGAKVFGEGQVAPAVPTVPLEQAAQPSYPVLAEAWNKYLDGEEYGTTNDLADTVEGLIDSDEAPQGLADALDQFREEQAYDREVGGRGDMDTANKQFESAVQAAAEQMKQPQVLEQAAISNAGPIEAAKQLVEEAGRESFNDIESFFAEKWPALLSATGKQLDLDEANFQEAAKRGISDLSKFIADNPKFADYYKNDWELTRNVLSDFYGRQITDDEFVMFRTIAGLTSPNTTLPLNISDTVNFFDWWTKNGNFDAVKLGPKPETGTLVLLEKPFSISGTTGNIKARSIKVVEELVKRFGNAVDAIEFLREMVPVSELHKFNKEMGYAGSVSNIGNIRSLVKQATGQDLLIPRMFIFGQKVGAYTLNAVGDSRYTTVDIWESRFIRSYFTGMFAKNTGLPVDSIEHDVFTRFNEVFKEEFEKETGKSWEPSALQAMRWFYIIDAAKQSGYSRASTNETISFYTERKLQKSYGYRGYGVVDSQSRPAGDGASSAGIEGQQILQQSAVVSATTYSALDKAVSEVTAKSLAAAGWKEQIKGWVNKGIVKQSEIEWSGLVEYLDMQEGKITKETVSEFLKNNGVKVETVTLGDRLPVLKSAVLKGIDDAQADLIKPYATNTELKNEFETYRKLVEADAPRDQLAEARSRIDNRLGDEFVIYLDDYIENAYQGDAEAKYSQYVLPGGKNYREVLVTLPVGFAPPAPALSKEGLAARQVVFDKYAPRLAEIENKLKEYNRRDGDEMVVESRRQKKFAILDERSELENKRDAEANALYKIPSAPEAKPFMSEHWDEFNVLVHLRMNDRTDADGKRVLFVEEVQSDWGQQGKKVGFEDAVGRAAALALLPAEEQKLNALQENAIDARIAKNNELANSLYEQMEPQRNIVENLQAVAYGSINIAKAPFVETTDGWLNLGLKHVMLEAVNGNYDRVAFIDGDQSVTRYKDALTEAVDEIEIRRNDDGTYTYNANKAGGTIQREASVSAKRIGEVFGKAGSKQLLEQADANPNEIYTISSEDIQIGGEGMRKFYDDVLPAALNKLLKKYGGGKLGTTKIQAKEMPPGRQQELNEMSLEDKQDQIAFEVFGTDSYDELNDRSRDDVDERIRNLANKGGMQPSFDVTVAFIEKVNQGLPLFQAMPSGKPRATFDLSTFFLTLNTAADLSSYLHEMAHFYMATYVNIANEPGAPSQITADLQIIFDWLGIKDLAAWNAMTMEEQRKYWEAFGYNHEIYLFEGKSPSVEMQGVFDRFSAWLRKIYKNIRDELNVIYRREFGEDLPMLTPEVRGVMDRMLASEKQIQYAESVNNMTPLFLTQEQSGYDDARWAAYQAMVQEAHDQSVTDLTKASLRQMEWLSNARTRLLKEMQAKHDDIRDKMRSDIADEVAAEPVYMAMSVLKTGKGRVANGEMVVFSDKYKLNLAIVKTMIPAENLSKLGYGKFGMLSEDGLHPDMVAEMFGFKSGDELVLALLAAKPVKEEVDSRLDARMLTEYGDMNTPAEIEVQVQKALHNEARERFIGVEARFVASATRPVRAMTDAARLAANTIVNAQKIEKIRPSNYAAAEARAARDAADAYKQRQSPEQARKTSYTRSYNEQIAAGVDEATAVAEATKKGDQAAAAAKDRQDAFAAKYGNREPAQVIIRAKQAQVVQNQLVKVSTAALEEVDKALKDFRRFFKADEKIAKNRNMDLVDAARSILAFYGLGKHDKLPSAYTDKLQAYNPEMYEAVRPIIEMSQQAGAGGDYETLTMSEFRMMREVVDALWAQSRRDQQIKIADEMVSVEQARAELAARLDEIGVPKEAVGAKQAPTTKDKAIRHLLTAKALIRRVENWANATDGPDGVGPFTKYIWRPVKNAVTAYRADRNKYVKKYVELLDKVDLPVGKIRSDELDYTFGVGNGGNGKAELLGAMLHMGNEGNLRKLLVGRNWSTIAADDSIDTARWDAFVERMINEGKLTKEDFEFLQATWDLLEEIKPIAQKAHRDLYGYYFNEIEAKSFTNRFGTYRGGYVPAKTDAFLVRDAQRQAKMEELEADFRASMPSTGLGFTMGRVEYNRPLSMDARLIAGHIDDVLRFSHIQPAVKDVLKLLGRGEFVDKLTAIDAVVIDEMLLPWLNRTARQTTSAPGYLKSVDKFWTAVRSRTGMSIMFANLRNAMQQTTGLFPAALMVNKGELKNALSTYLGSPMKTAESVAALSPFMDERMHSQIFEMQERMNELLLNPSKYAQFKDWTKQHAYFLQSAFQNSVDIVTWTGKYNQVLAEIGTDMTEAEAQAEAVQQADAAVRLTQGSMSTEDVARFEVGTPFWKTMTQFMGYFNMLANLNADEYIKVFRDMGWRGNKGKLLMIYILGFAAPTLVADAIARSLGQGWDDDDDGYLDDVADWLFGSQARAAAAMVPFGSAAYTALTTAFNDKPYDDRITSSPSISSIEASTIGVGKAIINIADDDKELTGKNVRDVLTLVSNVTGIPVAVLGRPISYQVDVARGKVEPTNPLDYMRGLMTGVPSAESKKK